MTPTKRREALEMAQRINQLSVRGKTLTFPMHTKYEVTLIRDALVLLAVYDQEDSHVR